jgi:Spy/CpxP family protein refolding chaperone
MKIAKTLIPSLLAALFINAATLAYAGDDKQQKHEARMQERLEEMKKELNLSDDQAAQIKTLQQSHMEKRKAERDAMQKEMDAILTPEQQEKAKKMREERKEKRRSRHADHHPE